jgi:ABC-type transport system involved in cytochrome bd biosynthesis fused ATPase/permease subunit
LTKFFRDPISVELAAYKETKAAGMKPCIALNIVYKEMKCEFNMLSGGEQDRLMVCFLLSFNEMYASKLLILDEAFSSLDEELVTDILNVLHENVKDKYVLIVAHQIGEGLFDNVVTV